MARSRREVNETHSCADRVTLAGTEGCVDGPPHLFVDRIELRHPERRDEGANEALARQVNAFCKRAAKHREADARHVEREPG